MSRRVPIAALIGLVAVCTSARIPALSPAWASMRVGVGEASGDTARTSAAAMALRVSGAWLGGRFVCRECRARGNHVCGRSEQTRTKVREETIASERQSFGMTQYVLSICHHQAPLPLTAFAMRAISAASEVDRAPINRDKSSGSCR